MAQHMRAQDNEEDVIRILVSTDHHLGFMEKDEVRGEDSFITFEEILRVARAERVDFVLFGGDIFHENKPSRTTLHRTMTILRKYCFGERPVKICIHSDPTVNFTTPVNFLDPHLSIDVPIFSIHGNHDDPAGEERLSALDLLSTANLVNYFGKADNVDKIKVYPLLLSKGHTKLAIYGLGSIRDERLYHTMDQKNVSFVRPKGDEREWFNLLAIHQNRVHHNAKNYIPEHFLGELFDFVIWCHEHECLITPTESAEAKSIIVQPGSSVATTLSDGEAKLKHIAVMEIKGTQFNFRPIPLTTVRPFLIDDLVLADVNPPIPPDDPRVEEKIVATLSKKVDEMIATASRDFPSPSPHLRLPLIRLKVEYTGFRTINTRRFGQQFIDRVANHADILLFQRKRVTVLRKKDGKDMADAFSVLSVGEQHDEVAILDLVPDSLKDDNGMHLLSEVDLSNAIRKYVEKDEKQAIAEYVAHCLSETQSDLRSRVQTENHQEAEIQRVVMERLKARKEKEEREAQAKALERGHSSTLPPLQHTSRQREIPSRKGKGNTKSQDSDREEESRMITTSDGDEGASAGRERRPPEKTKRALLGDHSSRLTTPKRGRIGERVPHDDESDEDDTALPNTLKLKGRWGKH